MGEISYDIKKAVRTLENGDLVAFPTETVYGLGADAENAQAVAKIYALKGRPANHPLTVHLAPKADITDWARDIPDAAYRLIDTFIPGPLTLILKRQTRVSDIVTGGQDSVGIRFPSHPIAQELLSEFKGGQGGIVAPSANRFGKISPTTALHVKEEFGNDERLKIILDGGASDIGIESTILDLSRWETKGAVLLRSGHITPQMIEKCIGVFPFPADDSAPRASGTSASHYAPRTPLILIETKNFSDKVKMFSGEGKKIAVMIYTESLSTDNAIKQLLPQNSTDYARALYAALHELDSIGADVILVETPPEGASWQSVHDRLRRAAYGFSDLQF